MTVERRDEQDDGIARRGVGFFTHCSEAILLALAELGGNEFGGNSRSHSRFLYIMFYLV